MLHDSCKLCLCWYKIRRIGVERIWHRKRTTRRRDRCRRGGRSWCKSFKWSTSCCKAVNSFASIWGLARCTNSLPLSRILNSLYKVADNKDPNPCTICAKTPFSIKFEGSIGAAIKFWKDEPPKWVSTCAAVVIKAQQLVKYPVSLAWSQVWSGFIGGGGKALDNFHPCLDW